MIVDVIAVTVLEGHRLWLKFDDGTEGEFDFGCAVGFEGIFAPLREPEYFAMAKLDPELSSVAWPNGADLDPLVLHAAIQGRTVQVA